MKTKKKKDLLGEQIERLEERLAITDPLSNEYQVMLSALENLKKLKEKKSKISPDTIAIILGNLAIVGIVVVAEKSEIISTKALQFLTKFR